jgi:hypothetical protein
MEATALTIYAAAWGPTVRGTPKKFLLYFRLFVEHCVQKILTLLHLHCQFKTKCQYGPKYHKPPL